MMTAEEMAANAGYDRTRKEHPWNGHDVWSVWSGSFEGRRIGYPRYIISDALKMRFATFDEVEQIMQYETETYKEKGHYVTGQEKGENLDLSESQRLHNLKERRTGVEPASQPWEGRILPLN